MMAKKKRLPKVGEVYEAKGYRFFVDDIKDGEVLVTRWGKMGPRLIRVRLATWQKEMVGVDPENKR